MRIVVLYSGGLDSTVLLYHLLRDHEVRALSVHYGQRHRRELDAATALTTHLGVPHVVVDLSDLRKILTGSSQTDDTVPVPHGHYAEETMKATVVPNRNMLLLGSAIAWAIATKSDAVAYAAHAGDHAIYPDCRAEFVEAMRQATLLADWHPVQLIAPFVEKTKTDLVRLGVDLGVPFAQTWSCYEGGAVHCGRCGTDVERQEAFRDSGVPDPTIYGDASGAFRG